MSDTAFKKPSVRTMLLVVAHKIIKRVGEGILFSTSASQGSRETMIEFQIKTLRIMTAIEDKYGREAINKPVTDKVFIDFVKMLKSRGPIREKIRELVCEYGAEAIDGIAHLGDEPETLSRILWTPAGSYQLLKALMMKAGR